MDRGVHPSLPIIKGIPFSAAQYVKAQGGRGFVCLCCDGLPCDELVLIRVDNGVQMPIYYVSKSLHEVEIHYLPLEKAILAMVHATRKLPHYFQSYTVVVLTQLPLRALLRSADFIGRISKWGTTLGAFDFKYMLLWETAPPARFMGCWAKPTWMGGVVFLPLKMEVRLVIFSPLD